jgi:drug/metabolite transporter (DMT)-like permease
VNALWNSALGLLLATGLLLGLTPPLAKLATEAGVPALIWALLISLGVGFALLAVRLVRGGGFALDPDRLRYFLIAGAISFALPNVLMFSVIPHLGAGYTAILLTLSPMLTLLLSLLLGVRRPSALGIAGILVGFAGALLVALTKGQADRPADLFWVVLGLCIPLTLAGGNIYRTLDWPKGAHPLELAAGSHLASAAMLLATLFAMGEAGALASLAEVPLLTLAQLASASAMFAVFFRLQAVGGPVYLSQIGYVAAAVGLAIGVAFLGERYAALTWIGAAVIFLGVVLTTKAQTRNGR